MFSYLKSRLAKRNQRKSGHHAPHGREKKDLRLLLEALEDRRLLAVRFWTGAGPDQYWSDAANWQGSVAPLPDDKLVFPTGAIGKTSIDDYQNGTRFSSITISDSGYTIENLQAQNATQANNGIVLLDGVLANFAGNTTSPTSFTSSTFNVPITLGSAQTFQSANAGARLYLGAINTADIEDNLDGTPSGIYVQGSGDIEVDGVISGRGGIAKSGTGTLYLTGANSFLGGTELFEGSIKAESGSVNGSNSGAFGQSTSVVVVQNYVSGSIQLSGGITINNPLALGNLNDGINYDIGTLRNVSGTNTGMARSRCRPTMGPPPPTPKTTP